MIFITGDTHCPIDIKKLNTENFPQQKILSKDDFVIICGDFGAVWHKPTSKGYSEDKYWLKWLDSKTFTTLFVDGNHENFELLNAYPTVNKYGGKMGKINDSVYHLKRGEIYTLDGKKFFCFGGASSHDKVYRKEGISWWEEELPNLEEMTYGVDNLDKVGNKVDYIITHCCSSEIQEKISPYYETDSLTQFFNFIQREIEYKHWFFGHYHEDRVLDDKHTCVYNTIITLD